MDQVDNGIMANLDYLTNFMPVKWHQERVAPTEPSDSFSFGWSGSGDRDLEKGSMAELQVAAWINEFTTDQHYLFNHLLVPNMNSVTGDTEIDIVWLSPVGILVVEVKSFNYSIDIHKGENWVGRSPGSGSLWNIENPVGQCIRQATALRQCLKSRKLKMPVYSLIALPYATELNFIEHPRIPVLNSREQLLSFYKEMQTGKPLTSDIRMAISVLNEFKRS